MSGRRWPPPVVIVSALGLALCVWLAVLVMTTGPPALFTGVLVVCAVIASRTVAELDDRFLLDASSSIGLCAAATTGPLGALVISAAAGIAAWQAERYRAVAFLPNLLANVAPAVLAALALEPLYPVEGSGFLVAVVLVGLCSAALNAVLVSMLFKMLDGGSLGKWLAELATMAPAVLLSVGFGAIAVAVYRAEGVAAAAFLLGGILAFAYLTGQMLAARRSAKEVALLAERRSQLVGEVLNAEERERRHLAEAIHDEAVQNLLAARQDLRDAERGDTASAKRARAAVEQAVAQLRATVSELHPTVLSHSGLEPALRRLTDQHAARGSFRATLRVSDAIPPDSEKLTFSLARELLANCAKHAAAQEVVLVADLRGTSVVLEVSDDGVGMTADERSRALAAGHIGLAASLERVEALGGNFSIVSAPGEGTRVIAQFPVQNSDAAPTLPAPSERQPEPAALQ